MKDYLKFFGSIAVIGTILLVLGHIATTNPEIRSFNGKGALFAGYAALGIGLILSIGGSLGLLCLAKKLLNEKVLRRSKIV